MRVGHRAALPTGDAPAEEDTAGAFDPGAHTVADVVAYVTEHPDTLEAVTTAEEAGKARVTLLDALYGMAP